MKEDTALGPEVLWDLVNLLRLVGEWGAEPLFGPGVVRLAARAEALLPRVIAAYADALQQHAIVQPAHTAGSCA